ncbi:hypothetical protein LIER_37046 [Lithospermum erythrorhizon]|uniref:Uncharacterized protein n=1 Tax=Lithospermum erythrorhizon TaxID=34254 RepID=A0AAV3PFA7_LITER
MFEHSNRAIMFEKKIIVDSLNPANTPLPSSVSTRDLTPSSTITTAGTKAFIDSSNPVNMLLSLAFSASDSTPSPVMSISGTKVEGTGQTVESATLQITSVKSELGVKQVKESTVQLLKSRDVRPRSKKILDAVVNALIEDHYGNDILDEGWFNQQKTTKAAVVLLNLLGVITAIWFLISGHQRATFGPTPT